MKTKKLTKEIGKRLRQARLKAGYNTISSFVEQHNFAKSTYTQYELGARSLHVELAIQFADLFETNLIWLLTGKGSIEHNNDLIAIMPEKISQEEFLSILTIKDRNFTKNFKKISQKKSDNYKMNNNISILSYIISKIIQCYEKKLIPLDFKYILDIMFEIYFDVSDKTQIKQEQIHFIDTAITIFDKMISYKNVS